jgi:nucleotide-binding universal stress UspA family protein
VFEAANPADAILSYACANHVDDIVMGARGESPMRRLLGSVSAEVAAHAPCSVTVTQLRECKPAANEDEPPVSAAAN